MREKIRTIVSAILNLPEAEIHGELSPKTVDRWDSLAHLRLVTAIEEEFDITFSMDEVESIERLDDFFGLVEQKAGVA